eukprot:gene28584-35453_t
MRATADKDCTCTCVTVFTAHIETYGSCLTWDDEVFKESISFALEQPFERFWIEANQGIVFTGEGCSTTSRRLLQNEENRVSVDFYIEPPENEIYFDAEVVAGLSTDFEAGNWADSWNDELLGPPDLSTTRYEAPRTLSTEPSPPPPMQTATESSGSDDGDDTVIIIGTAAGAVALLGIGGFFLWRHTQKRVTPKRKPEEA